MPPSCREQQQNTQLNNTIEAVEEAEKTVDFVRPVARGWRRGRLPDTGIICGGANQCSFGAENRRVEGEQNNAETVADLIALRVYDSQLSIARQDYESYESRDKSSGAVRPLPSWAMPVPPIQPHAAGRPAAPDPIGRRYSPTPP